MSSKKYKAFNDEDEGDKIGQADSFDNNVVHDSLSQNAKEVQVLEGSFAATQSPTSAASGGSDSSGGSNSNPFFSLTKKKKKRKEPKIQSSGVVNYGGFDNSDSESDSASTLSSAPNQLGGYNLPFHMTSGYPNNQHTDEVEDDELSQRTPIPKVLPSSAMNAILPSDFLRHRAQSDTNMSDISEDDSIIKRQKREEENVGRLVHAAKQQQSFAQAWFSAGQTQNALPPIPPKNKLPSNAPPGVKKTNFKVPSKSSGPIDLDSGEAWGGDNETTANHSKKNWEIGSLGFHSAPTKKRANKKDLPFGVPDDEDLTTYFIANKCLERIVCVIGGNNCTLLALLVIGFFVLLLAGGAIAAGIFLASKDKIAPSQVPSAAPTFSQQPTLSLVPSSSPIGLPSTTPSSAPSTTPTSKPSLRPSAHPSSSPSKEPTSQPSSKPSSRPSSKPTNSPTSKPSSQPSLSSQPTSSPSDQPSRCFPSVSYESQGAIQRLSDGFRDDRNGYAVSMSQSGNIVAVSAIRYPQGKGSVTVYELSTNQGVQWLKKGQRIESEADFGNSLELSNDGLTLIIGSPTAQSTGLARVYRYNSNSNLWIQLGSDIVEENSLIAGFTVAISGNGNVVAVGDPNYDFGYGRVVVYEYKSNDWFQRGGTLVGLSSIGEFGHSVSLSLNGNIVACGAPRGGTATFSIAGSVHIYKWDGSSQWNPLGGEIISFDFISPPRFGDKVSLADDESQPRVAIGSPFKTVQSKSNSGSVSVWEYDPFQDWRQIGTDLEGTPASNQRFGTSISFAGNGNHVSVGLPLYGKGQAYVYFYNGDIWDASDPLSGNDFASNFGNAVALSKDGTRLVVGASTEISPGYWQVFKASKGCGI